MIELNSIYFVDAVKRITYKFTLTENFIQRYAVSKSPTS